MIVYCYSSGRHDMGMIAPIRNALTKAHINTCLLTDGTHVGAMLGGRPKSDADTAIADGAVETMRGISSTLTSDDVLLLVGDRTETLAAAFAATCLRVPIYHVHGGETTLGAIDDRCRHAITRLASFHAVAHRDYAQRLIRWGEPPTRVIVSGAPAIDEMTNSHPVSTPDLQARLGFKIAPQMILVTLHPATLGADPSKEVEDMIHGIDHALMAYPDAQVIATKSNADAGGEVINRALANHRRTLVVRDLGCRNWWGLMARAAVLVGNSSSGIIEAPSYGLPVVNIGDRQRGRLRAGEVIDANGPHDIGAAIMACLNRSYPVPRPLRASPLGDGTAGARIAEVFKHIETLTRQQRLEKEFI